MPSSFYPNHFVPLHKRSVTKIVGIQTFLADGDNVAISQERQYAKVWTREDSHLCHKMSKPRLLIIVSFAAHPLTLMFRPSILRQLHNPPTPGLQIFFSLLQNIFCYTGESSCPLRRIECGRQACYVQSVSVSCGKDKAHLSCRQECPICPLRNCLFLSDISFHLPRNYTATPHALAKRYKVCRHTDTFGWWQHVAFSQRWQYAKAPMRESCLSVLQAIKAETLMTCITDSHHTCLLSVQQTCKRFTAHPFLFQSFFSPLYDKM